LPAPRDKDLRSAALFVVSHHPDWAGGVLARGSSCAFETGISARLNPKVLRDALLAFITDDGRARSLYRRSLADAGLGRAAGPCFLLDTIDTGSLKQFPAGWVGRLGAALLEGAKSERYGLAGTRPDSLPTPSRSSMPSLNRIADDASSPDPARVAALAGACPQAGRRAIRFP